MLFHVRTYLAGHPLLRGFQVRTEADDSGITAELRYAGRVVRAVHTDSDWWTPAGPERGRELADLLARNLYAQWMTLLRRR